MKKNVLLFLFVILYVRAFSQKDTVDLVNVPVSDSVYTKVEIDASFPGGVIKWREYLMQNLNAAIPLDRGAPAGIYTVIIQFIVNKNGEISDIKALTNHGYGMEEESLKMIKKGPKKWIPAQVNGKPVNAYRKQPITFQVLSDN